MKLLQIRAAFGVITNYGNTLLQITAGITIYDVITNYVVTFDAKKRRTRLFTNSSPIVSFSK